jgi:hypothetical protein
MRGALPHAPIRTLLCAGSIRLASPGRAADLSGWWYVRDTVEQSEYGPFAGLTLGYRIHLDQDGVWILGRGEKSCENGRPLPPRRRTPIALAGTADGNTVIVRLVEDGHRRRTVGTFSWTAVGDGHRLAGTFAATAGNSKGRSVAARTHEKPPPCGVIRTPSPARGRP